MYPEINNNCGCPDNTVPSVEIPAPPACSGEPCPEIINTTCVRYDGPAIECITTTANMTLNALLVAITDKLCALDAGGTGGGAVTGVEWGCLPTPGTTSVSDAVQVLADAINAGAIKYNSSDFTVSYATDCADRILSFNKGSWIQIPNNNIVFYNGFTAATPIYYMVDTDGMIHLKGAFSKPTVVDISTATHPSGSVGIKIAELPGYLLPVSERNTNPSSGGDYPIIHAAGFNNTCSYSSPVNANYNLNWILSCGKVVIGGSYYFAINAYVPYSATVNGGGNVGGATNVSMYLHSLKYSSL